LFTIVGAVRGSSRQPLDFSGLAEGTLVAPADPSGGPMNDRAQPGWDRLQAMLEALVPGDEIHVATASHETGMTTAMCERVLEALTRVDLFTRSGDEVFVRRRLPDAASDGSQVTSRKSQVSSGVATDDSRLNGSRPDRDSRLAT
jgi:hypothetical protein